MCVFVTLSVFAVLSHRFRMHIALGKFNGDRFFFSSFTWVWTVKKWNSNWKGEKYIHTNIAHTPYIYNVHKTDGRTYHLCTDFLWCENSDKKNFYRKLFEIPQTGDTIFTIIISILLLYSIYIYFIHEITVNEMVEKRCDVIFFSSLLARLIRQTWAWVHSLTNYYSPATEKAKKKKIIMNGSVFTVLIYL